ncbi:hypothetical protein [Flavobacterium sp. ENC]|uniref:hypothetical protein n=1 Tax=Flavobacterium sp. ENC TaxID=2897330 RepID=UPI001E3E83C3|nr:hypothetical protein [Flavobacterium sp. ENC]MCD0465077.1 hypothetical protein [Flavobacterium sp. ENC]
MKNKILLCIIGLIGLILFYYKTDTYFEPYKYANKASKLNIYYNNKVIKYFRSVGDFDGGIEMEIEFNINNSELNNIEGQVKKMNYKHPSLALQSENLKYAGDSKVVYFFSKHSQNGSVFIIFNKTKGILLIKQNTIN